MRKAEGSYVVDGWTVTVSYDDTHYHRNGVKGNRKHTSSYERTGWKRYYHPHSVDAKGQILWRKVGVAQGAFVKHAA